MTDAAIVAEGIGKRFGPVPALDGVDLVLPAGGVLGLQGPNGAGKPDTGLWHFFAFRRRGSPSTAVPPAVTRQVIKVDRLGTELGRRAECRCTRVQRRSCRP